MKDKKSVRLIYNPFAGNKRRVVPGTQAVTLEEIELLFQQYQIECDFVPTKYPGHATLLAFQSVKQGYSTVIAAGGDGTVAEVANGLVDTNVTLGIIPLGSFMNVAWMLSIPLDVEKAVQLIKIGRVRKIDVGSVTLLNGQHPKKPKYFLEEAGIGLEAEIHQHFTKIGESQITVGVWGLIKSLTGFNRDKVNLIIDNKSVQTRATLITISNGPFTWTSVPVAPEAKLNDHLFTISLWRMSKWEIVAYLFQLFVQGYIRHPKIETFKSKTVRLETKDKRLVHADSRVFGTTPVEFQVVPNALNVITGFPKAENSYLKKRTYLDP